MALRRAASSSLRQLAGRGWAAEASSSSVLQGASHEALVSAWLWAQVTQHRVISSAWQPSWIAQRASIHCWQGASFAAQPAVAESSDDSQEADAPSAGSKVHTPECARSDDGPSMAVQPDPQVSALPGHLGLESTTAAKGIAVLTSKAAVWVCSQMSQSQQHACTDLASPLRCSCRAKTRCVHAAQAQLRGLPASGMQAASISHPGWSDSQPVACTRPSRRPSTSQPSREERP